MRTHFQLTQQFYVEVVYGLAQDSVKTQVVWFEKFNISQLRSNLREQN